MKYIRIFVLALLNLHTLCFSQNRYDVVIDEIMCDPSPALGLPNNEWLELRNTTANSINLQNWRIGDISGQSGPFPNFLLQPDSFVIICPTSAVAALSVFGPTISVTSFPSLDNENDQLFLKAANGKTIHAVNYSSSWYKNELKADGGWTLEMIDIKNPCSGFSNWKASTDQIGGTPGKKNSIDAINDDKAGPKLKRAYTSGNTTITLAFDESIDSLSGATISNYAIDGGLSLTTAISIPPLFNEVQLDTNNPLAANTVYTVTASNVIDCKNNSIQTDNKAKTGLPVDPIEKEWIINEILFNPPNGGFDYVEFYNNSNKIFDASKLYIANRNSGGTVGSIRPLSATPFYIFPGDYIAVTEDADNLALNYLMSNPENIITLSSMPSFPDDKGNVVALNFQGSVVDEVKYDYNWHFRLISNAEGVSLERIDPSGASQDMSNWHSAASTAGYGTPGYRNSQHMQPGINNATIDINPKIFSPDNDGRDDIAILQYKMNEPGYVCNVTIFNVAGQPIRNLVRSAVLGISGYWNWDGLDEKGLKLPVGTYIIYTEIFNLQGKSKRFKNVVVVARGPTPDPTPGP